MSRKYPYQNLSLKDMKGEVWEDIPGLDGYYCISNFGRVQREEFEILCKNGMIKYMPQKIMKTGLYIIKNNSVNDYVYFLQVKIMQSGYKHHISIARIVYYLFVKKFDLSNKHLVVLPKDGNGKNIYPANLVLANIHQKQKRIFERGRMIRHFYYTYDEYIKEGVEKSVNPFCKQISQYTPEGKKIQTFPSTKAAALTLKIRAAGINSVLKNRQVSCGGFVWRYGKARQVDMKSFWENKKIQFHKKRGEKITQYDLNGKKVAAYTAIAEAGRITGLHRSEISNAVNGKLKTSGGFIWKKGVGKPSIDVRGFVYGAALRGKNQQKKIKQYSSAGKYIQTFNSVKAAGEYLGVTASTLSIACNKNNRTCKGYKWRFVKPNPEKRQPLRFKQAL